jgi:hypothetical protein
MASEQIADMHNLQLMIRELIEYEGDLSQQYKILIQAIDTCNQVMCGDKIYKEHYPYFMEGAKSLTKAIKCAKRARESFQQEYRWLSDLLNGG